MSVDWERPLKIVMSDAPCRLVAYGEYGYTVITDHGTFWDCDEHGRQGDVQVVTNVTPARHHDQSRLDSLAEALTNTAIGFVISMVTWHFVARGFGIPMPIGENLMITGIFTVVSIVRQYVLRRAFDGRSVWRVIRGNR